MRRRTFGRLTAVAITLAAVLGGPAATSAVMPHRQAAQKTAVVAPLVVYGGRSLAQQRSGVGAKLDAALAGLARQAEHVPPGSAMRDLRSLNPAARFMVMPRSGTAYVAIDAITRGDPQALKRALVGVGLQHPAVYLNDVGGWLPLTAIESATQLTEVHSMRAAMSRTHTGAVTSQGDYVQGSAALRGSNPTLMGTGITVGILSDSFNCYAVYATPGSGVPASGNAGYASNGFSADAAMDLSTGDLPASSSVNILEEPGATTNSTCMDFGAPYLLPYGDEGRAMMQIVQDVAPGAKLAFHTAVESEADFANGIQGLVNAGVQVIADDVTYFDEPFFQDGLLSQAANSANAAGVAYFSAAGNSGSNGYDNLAPDFSNAATSPAGEHVLNFDTTGATKTLALTVNLPQLVPGEFVSIILQWDQPYVTGAPASGGATSQMDLCVASPSGTGLIASPVNPDPGSPSPITDLTSTQVCTGANSTGVDPYQVLVIGYPANATTGSTCPAGLTATVCSAAQNITIQVGLVAGAAPTRIKVAVDDDGAGSTFAGVPVTGGTLQGHPSASGVMAVGAVFWDDTPDCGTTPAVLETFSAKGGDPILFDSSGTALNPPGGEMRQKPDIAGPDGGSDTFLGFALGAGGSGQCINSASFPNFFGTSAATPHVAAVAALLLQQFPGINPSALYTALKAGAGALTNNSPAGSPPAVNYAGGYGLLQAENAFAALPAAPNISLDLSPTTVNVGTSAKLSWTVTNATTCTASGAWSGTQALSGSMTFTPSASGSATYNLTCTNASGYAEATQVLTANSGGGGGGGGGGALDLTSLAALAALAGACRRRRRV